jgi:hypothetical protein
MVFSDFGLTFISSCIALDFFWRRGENECLWTPVCGGAIVGGTVAQCGMPLIVVVSGK